MHNLLFLHTYVLTCILHPYCACTMLFLLYYSRVLYVRMYMHTTHILYVIRICIILIYIVLLQISTTCVSYVSLLSTGKHVCTYVYALRIDTHCTMPTHIDICTYMYMCVNAYCVCGCVFCY